MNHKAVQLLDTGLTGTVRRKIQRHARLDEATDSYMLSAFLDSFHFSDISSKDICRLSLVS